MAVAFICLAGSVSALDMHHCRPGSVSKVCGLQVGQVSFLWVLRFLPTIRLKHANNRDL